MELSSIFLPKLGTATGRLRRAASDVPFQRVFIGTMIYSADWERGVRLASADEAPWNNSARPGRVASPPRYAPSLNFHWLGAKRIPVSRRSFSAFRR